MKKETKLNALKEILYGAGISFGLGIVGYILMFIFKIAAARYLGPSQFGMYEMMVTVLGIFVVFSTFGLENGIQRFASEYLSKKKSGLLHGYQIFCFRLVLFTSLSSFMVLFFLSDKIAAFLHFGEEFSILLRIISVGIIFRALREVSQHFLLAYRKPFSSGLGPNIIEKVILVFGICIVSFLNLSLAWMAVFLGISLILSYLVTFLFYLGPRQRSGLPKYEIRNWFVYSTPLLALGALIYILNWTDNFIIARNMTSVDVGLYSVSFSLASYIPSLTAMLGSLFLPVMVPLYMKDRKSFSETFKQITKWGVMNAVFFGAIFVMFSKPLLDILFGKEYMAASASFVILVMFFVGMSALSFRSQLLLIEKDTQFILWNTLLWSVVNIVLGISLVHIYGINGVAFSTGISFFMLKLCEYARTRRYYNVNEDYKVYFKIAAIGIVSAYSVKASFLFLLSHFMIDQSIKILIALILYTICFIVLIFMMRVLNKDDIKLLLEIEKKFGINMGLIKNILKKL